MLEFEFVPKLEHIFMHAKQILRANEWHVDIQSLVGDFHFATLASSRTGGRSIKTCWGEQRDRHWDGIGYLGTPFTFPKGSEF